VFTGPNGEEETVIRLTGTVEPIPMGVIRMEPRKTVVGELSANKENEVQIVIENDGDAAFTITRIISKKFDTVYFSADEKGGIEIGPGRHKTIKFAVTPVEHGRLLDRIIIFSDARNDIGEGYTGLLSGTVK